MPENKTQAVQDSREKLYVGLESCTRDELLHCIKETVQFHPKTIPWLHKSYKGILADREEAAQLSGKVIDFDHYSKSCWRALFKDGKDMRPDERVRYAEYVVSEIYDAISTIEHHAILAQRWETFRSALETYRKISKSLIICPLEEIRAGVMASHIPRALAIAINNVLVRVEMIDEDELEEGLLWSVEHYKAEGYARSWWDLVTVSLLEMRSNRPRSRILPA